MEIFESKNTLPDELNQPLPRHVRASSSCWWIWIVLGMIIWGTGLFVIFFSYKIDVQHAPKSAQLIEYVLYICSVLYGFSLIFTLPRFFGQRYLVKTGIAVHGQIAGNVTGYRKDTSWVYEFRTLSGQLITGSCKRTAPPVGSSGSSGQAVVLYDQEDPAKSILYPADLVTCWQP